MNSVNHKIRPYLRLFEQFLPILAGFDEDGFQAGVLSAGDVVVKVVAYHGRVAHPALKRGCGFSESCQYRLV